MFIINIIEISPPAFDARDTTDKNYCYLSDTYISNIF